MDLEVDNKLEVDMKGRIKFSNHKAKITDFGLLIQVGLYLFFTCAMATTSPSTPIQCNPAQSDGLVKSIQRYYPLSPSLFISSKRASLFTWTAPKKSSDLPTSSCGAAPRFEDYLDNDR